MKFKHKIKLIWARFNWWLSFTKRSKKYAEKMMEYSLIEEVIKHKQQLYNEEYRKGLMTARVKILEIEIKLLGELIG